jgi:cytochrome c-type biogenesis protein CcmH/NrfG
MESNKKSIWTKVFIIGAGIAFLVPSLLSLGGIGGRSDRSNENAAQSQNAQLQAQEKGFLTVLQREPNNQTALRGIGEIITMRMQQGDIPGTKALLEELVKVNPTKKEYKELLAAIDKQVADTKKVGTLEKTK